MKERFSPGKINNEESFFKKPQRIQQKSALDFSPTTLDVKLTSSHAIMRVIFVKLSNMFIQSLQDFD